MEEDTWSQQDNRTKNIVLSIITTKFLEHKEAKSVREKTLNYSILYYTLRFIAK